MASHRSATTLRLWFWLGAAVAVLALAHIYYWYWPRLHSAPVTSGEIPAGVVMASEGLEYRLWLAHPHQNLGLLEKQLGGIEEPLASLASLFGVPAVSLPSFGPFRFPPSYELAIATDRDGYRMILAARVFPAVRWVLRAAGELAGNPWLRGGEVEMGGRRLTVRWQSGTWLVTSGGAGLPVAPPGTSVEPTLALLRLASSEGPLPAGLYRMAIESGVLSLNLWPRLPGVEELLGGSQGSPLLGAATLWCRFETTATRQQAQAMALLLVDTPSPRLPAAVVFQAGDSERWQLPGEKLFALAGVRPMTHSLGHWRLTAYEESSLSTGEDLVPLLSTLAEQSARDGLDFAVEADLEEAGRVLSAVGRALEAVPLLGIRESGQWLALARLGELAGEFRRLSIRIAHQPDRFELRLAAAVSD